MMPLKSERSVLRAGQILLLSAGLLYAFLARGQAGVYLETNDFLAQAFNPVPASETLWLDDTLRATLAEILTHPYRGLRVRFWREGSKTVWILNEIGKEKPITIGVVVDRMRVERVAVLAFRESRGWEVRHPFFTDQFTGAGTGLNAGLDTPIDGISGATLSVRAVTRVTGMALHLHMHVMAASVAGAQPGQSR